MAWKRKRKLWEEKLRIIITFIVILLSKFGQPNIICFHSSVSSWSVIPFQLIHFLQYYECFFYYRKCNQCYRYWSASSFMCVCELIWSNKFHHKNGQCHERLFAFSASKYIILYMLTSAKIERETTYKQRIYYRMICSSFIFGINGKALLSTLSTLHVCHFFPFCLLMVVKMHD